MSYEQNVNQQISDAVKQGLTAGNGSGSTEAGANSQTNTQFLNEQIARASVIAGTSNQQVRYAIEITNLQQMWWFAEIASKTEFVPKELRGKPADCFIAIQFGLELGISPMQALQNIAIINGKPCIWGDLLRALILAHPACEDILEEFIDDPVNGLTAKCVIKRKGRTRVVHMFSVEDAKKAGLWERRGKNGSPTPWVTYPKRMLQMRAFGFAARDAFADALRGLITREEAIDYPTTPQPQQTQQTQQQYVPKAEDIKIQHQGTHALYQSTQTKPSAESQIKQLERDVAILSPEYQHSLKQWLESRGVNSLSELGQDDFEKVKLRVEQKLSELKVERSANIVKLTELSKGIPVKWLADYAGLGDKIKFLADFPDEVIRQLIEKWDEVKEARKNHKPISNKQYKELANLIKGKSLTEEKVLAFLREERELHFNSLKELPVSKFVALNEDILALAEIS